MTRPTAADRAAATFHAARQPRMEQPTVNQATTPAPSARTRAEEAAVQLEHEMTQIVVEETGLREPLAGQLARAIVRGMRQRMGGEDTYIPAPDKSERNAAIRAEFRGTNLAEVCRKYGVGKSTVYDIVGQRGAA